MVHLYAEPNEKIFGGYVIELSRIRSAFCNGVRKDHGGMAGKDVRCGMEFRSEHEVVSSMYADSEIIRSVQYVFFPDSQITNRKDLNVQKISEFDIEKEFFVVATVSDCESTPSVVIMCEVKIVQQGIDRYTSRVRIRFQ
jgi:hypothetical protein